MYCIHIDKKTQKSVLVDHCCFEQITSDAVVGAETNECTTSAANGTNKEKIIHIHSPLEAMNMLNGSHTVDDRFGKMKAGNSSASFEQSASRDETNEEQEFLTEEDIEIFFELEEKGGEQRDTCDIESQLKPHLGQRFKTQEESQQFFNYYSSVAGFSSVIVSSYRTISKKRRNEVTRFTMKCNRHGTTTEIERENLVPQRQSTVIARTNCKVEMVASEGQDMWQITRLNLEHNHELSPDSRFFRSHKYMSDEEKDLIWTLKRTNNPTRKIVSILAYIRGGYGQLPYNKKAVSNYGTQINRELENTDMMEVVKIFNKKQA